MDINTVVPIIVAVIVVLFLIHEYRRDKKKEAEEKARIAANQAAWAIDYHNPQSQYFDPVRVEAELRALYDKIGVPFPPK